MISEIGDPTLYSAALYVRLSKEDDGEGQSGSVTNQLSLLNGFAHRHKLTVYDTYIDDGWSGTDFDRPAFVRMIGDIERRKINMVITKDLSRLGRDYIMTGHYMEKYFPEHRVRYISLLDGIDTGVDSTANDITPFRAIMNDMYAKDISKKIKSVKRDKQRRGEFIGGKPSYGYRMHPTQKNRLVVDEAAASVVRRIFSLAREGVSCRQIAVMLNEEGIPAPAVYAGLGAARRGAYSGLWSGERVSFMLKNETYIGSMVQGRSAKISYKTKKCLHREAKDWIVVENTHEPIINRETYDAVQRLIESRRHTRARTYDFILKGLIVCHECGYPLAVLNRKNANNEDCLYFVCRTYQRFTGAGVCSCHSIKEQTVTKAVISCLYKACKEYLSAELLLPLAKQAIAEAQTLADKRSEREALSLRVSRLIEHMDSMYMDRLNGMLSEDAFTRLYRRANEEREALERRLAAMPPPDERAATELWDGLAMELVKSFIENPFESKELLLMLIEKVELNKDKKVIVHCRFRPEGETV